MKLERVVPVKYLTGGKLFDDLLLKYGKNLVVSDP